jgi:signal transduction histidine kinase
MEIPRDNDPKQELAILTFAIRLILAELDHRILVERGLESFADFGRCERVAIYLLGPSSEILTVEGCTGTVLGADPIQFHVTGTPFEKVMLSKQPAHFQLNVLHKVPYPTYDTGEPGRQCLCVPLVEANNRALGVVTFDQPAGESLDSSAMQCLLILQSVLAISIENARVLGQLRETHAELETLYEAKTKMIDHLSHELKTPLAIISASSKILSKSSVRRDDKRYSSALERMDRSIERLLELEEEAGDIAKQRESMAKGILEGMIRQCQDLLETLVDQSDPPTPLLAKLTPRIEEIYLPPREDRKDSISLFQWVPEVLAAMEPLYQHRPVRVELDLFPSPAVRMPEVPLRKVVSGLIRNAIENTSDGGTVRVELHPQGDALVLLVRDFGVGIKEEDMRQLFHGFVHTGDTQDYSSGRPFDFKAGGKGLDLLRSKLFSERYGFDIQVESKYGTGSTFSLVFPASMLSLEAEKVAGGEEKERGTK